MWKTVNILYIVNKIYKTTWLATRILGLLAHILSCYCLRIHVVDKFWTTQNQLSSSFTFGLGGLYQLQHFRRFLGIITWHSMWTTQNQLSSSYMEWNIIENITRCQQHNWKVHPNWFVPTRNDNFTMPHIFIQKFGKPFF